MSEVLAGEPNSEYQSQYEIATKAYGTAVENLEANYREDFGLLAAGWPYCDLWFRDANSGTKGILGAGLSNAVKDTLTTSLENQRPDGLPPYRVLLSRMDFLRHLGRKPQEYKRPKANFRTRLTGGLVLDGGLSTIDAMRKYVEDTNDLEFLEKHYRQIKRAADWYYGATTDDHLLWQKPSTGMADSIWKWGYTSHTNIQLVQAMLAMGYLYNLYNSKGEETENKYNEKAGKAKKAINKIFWNEDREYLVDWVNHKGQLIYFAMHSGMKAAINKIVNQERAEQILDYAALNCKTEVVIKGDDGADETVSVFETNFPRYPNSIIYPLNVLIGMADYHNYGGDFFWLEPSILYSQAQQVMGDTDGARETLVNVATLINEHSGVNEIYEKANGQPVDRKLTLNILNQSFEIPFYKAAYPFSRSAAFFCEAYQLIFQNQ